MEWRMVLFFCGFHNSRYLDFSYVDDLHQSWELVIFLMVKICNYIRPSEERSGQKSVIGKGFRLDINKRLICT